jgi:hypothetical protein
MASNDQQWAITSRAKQQIRQTKRRERAQRMHMQVMMMNSHFEMAHLLLEFIPHN